MNRQQKELLVNTLKGDFKNSNASFLVMYKGLSVVKMQELRRGLKASGGKLKVAKDRLVKLAIKEIPEAKDLTPFLKDQVGIIFSTGDATGVAKVIYNFAKENEQLGIVAGSFESKIVDKDFVKLIASLPSREVLLAQICGTLNAPITQFTVVVNALLTKLSSGDEQVSEKKEELN